MKYYLFPRVFHTVGWILFVPAIIMGALILSELGDYSIGLDLPAGVWETVIYDAVIIGIAIGSVFIVCSKEKREDEMTRSIRLSALLNSLYIYVVLLVIGTLLVNGLSFTWIMLFNLVILPIIYVIIFRTEMHRYYKLTDDEEQD